MCSKPKSTSENVVCTYSKYMYVFIARETTSTITTNKKKIYYSKTTAASVLNSYFLTVVMMQVAEHTVRSIKV